MLTIQPKQSNESKRIIQIYSSTFLILAYKREKTFCRFGKIDLS